MCKSSVLLVIVLVFFLPNSKADDKRLGKLNEYRTCYDVKHYGIRVNVHPGSQSIHGSNTISLQFKKSSKLIQLDYVSGMRIENIANADGKALKYARRKRAVMIELPRQFESNEQFTFTVEFSGKPEVAKKAPWQGGFVWSKDMQGNDWVGLACESKGASIWLPCKDHWSDEPDSVDMFLGVPQGLTGVSNGRLVSESHEDSFIIFHWKTRNPINHYNISINIGKYAHISDEYKGRAGNLSQDFYVLSYNSARAIKHFEEADTMLAAFEHYFGPYPFYSDGYKLVETPYWGMEHQSCVAYGNNYHYNNFGFDFILVHESGHEWFANAITADDPADMWIHESFTTYSESLFVEYTQGTDSAISYLKGQRKNIVSKFPMQGPRGADFHGWKDNDIYYKGAWFLHTLRNHVGNDSIWFVFIRGMTTKFGYRVTNTASVLTYMKEALSLESNQELLSHYVSGKGIPVLKVRMVTGKSGRPELEYRLIGVPGKFELNFRLHIGDEVMFKASNQIRRMEFNPENFGKLRVLEDLYLIKVEGLNE